MSRRSQHLKRKIEREMGTEKKKLKKENANLVQPEELIVDGVDSRS